MEKGMQIETMMVLKMKGLWVWERRNEKSLAVSAFP